MAKQPERRWLVRDTGQVNAGPYSAEYAGCDGNPPVKTARGDWPQNRRWTVIPADLAEFLLPDKLHLKPGGGPVELPR